MASGKKSDAKKIKAVDRRIQALELRMRGVSYRDIGITLGVSHTTAARDVKKALADLKRHERLNAENLRHLMVERINVARFAIADLVMSGDLKALDRWIKLNEQEIKLYGLDEAVGMKLDLSDEMVSMVDALGLNLSDLVGKLEAVLKRKLNG